ncbi:taurine catabolism dioxygenase [Aureococcus anophagefferens]|nr:taurine catabolism dioxygenase [Aureococcus anophagefferens]
MHFERAGKMENFTASASSVHPLVRTHPRTGEDALYLSGNFIDRVDGMGRDESRPLVDALIAHATSPIYTYRHRWRAGDLVMWDNAATMHAVSTTPRAWRDDAPYDRGGRRAVPRALGRLTGARAARGARGPPRSVGRDELVVEGHEGQHGEGRGRLLLMRAQPREDAAVAGAGDVARRRQRRVVDGLHRRRRRRHAVLGRREDAGDFELRADAGRGNSKGQAARTASAGSAVAPKAAAAAKTTKSSVPSQDPPPAGLAGDAPTAASSICDGQRDSPVLPALVALAVVLAATVAGFHALWTHLVAVITTLLVVAHDGSDAGPVATALGAATVTYLSITIGWYGVLIVRRRDDFVGRAMHGWPKWIIEHVLVGCGVLPPGSTVPFDETGTYGHLVARAPVAYACLGFAATRLWCLACSLHDVPLDLSRGLGGARLRRRAAPAPQLFLRGALFSAIYGLVPPIGDGAIWTAYAGEVGAAVCFALANAAGAVPAAAFRRLGGADVVAPARSSPPPPPPPRSAPPSAPGAPRRSSRFADNAKRR